MRDVRGKGFAKPLRVNEAWDVFMREANLKPLSPEVVALRESLGRTLADDIQAELDIPPFDRAAVDGYAVRAEDTYGASAASPIVLNVVGVEEVGGETSLHVGEGEAARISTGAPMPVGADSVVMYEYTSSIDGSRVAIQKATAPGDNVSKRGEDVRKGETVLKRGTLLKPYDLGMLAAAGVTKVSVIRRPKVAVFSTGSELVEPGCKLGGGRIFDVNRYTLQALVREMGGDPLDFGIVHDSFKHVTATIERALEKADLVLGSGGTSAGSKDILPNAVNSLGEPGIIVHGVSIKPGRPVALAVIRGKPVVLLPGLPVAAVVAFLVFVRRILAVMLGSPSLGLGGGTVQARMIRSVASTPGVRSYVRVDLEKKRNGYVAIPIMAGGSGVISSMTRAKGMVVIPENVEGLAEGEEVEVILLRPLGEPL
ncbi:MAG: molybdopterin-binding protein [Candidatus Bathyarchaeia archaeon]